MLYFGEFDRPPVGLAGDTANTQVVDLWRRKATSCSRIASDVLEYWDKLRDGAALPYRMDVDPSRMGDALPYVFLLEYLAPGIARLRIAGRHLHDVMGRNVAGSPITSFCAPGARAEMLPLLDAVFDGPSCLSLDLLAERAGKPAKAAEILILPMADRMGKVTRALGCLVARGPIEFTPYRFSIQDARLTPLAKPVEVPSNWPLDVAAKAERIDTDWKSTSIPWLKVVQ